MKYHEPLRTTLLRTITIAAVVGAILARVWGSWSHWPMGTLLALWPSLGGHFVELLYLNVMHDRIPPARPIQTTTRLTIWFLGGAALSLAMGLTARALNFHPPRWPEWGPKWWIAGLGFIGIELIVHGAQWMRGCRSFYNGQG